MRSVILFVMYLWLEACTTPPLFPPEVMKGIENDTFAFKAWKDQASYTSARLVSHKVELEGQILKVIPKREGVIIVADGHPVDEQPLYDSQIRIGEDSFIFAIGVNGRLDPGMLQTGNRLVVVGMTDNPSAEAMGWMSRFLPHLRAQCLHIWKAQGVKSMFFSSSGYLGYYAPEERTFCQGDESR